MYVGQITLKNWKNFRNIEVPLGWRAFLIGPNASGKSNFLDAFRFLKEVAVDGLSKAVENRGGISAIRSLSARGDSHVMIQVKLYDKEKVQWIYRLSIKQNRQKSPIVVEERVWQGNAREVLSRPSSDDEEDPARLTQTALEQVSANKDFRPVADFFKSISYHHLLPQVVRDPGGFSPHPVQNDPYGRDFLQRMWKTPPKTRTSRLNKITEVLRVAVPQLEKLFLEMDPGTGIVHLIGRYTHWRSQGASQNERQFSDGTLRLLGLLWAVFEGTGPLLLEEPEISLHPEIIRRLPGMFHRIVHSSKQIRQILISTHSEAILQDEGIAPEEVLVLEPGPNGTEINLPEDGEITAIRRGKLTPADIFIPKVAPKHPEQLELVWKQ